MVGAEGTEREEGDEVTEGGGRMVMKKKWREYFFVLSLSLSVTRCL
jgi:hypothetical protein